MPAVPWMEKAAEQRADRLFILKFLKLPLAISLVLSRINIAVGI